MSKANPTKIRAAIALSSLQLPSGVQCFCGLLSSDLRAYREHDESDRPLPGPEHLVFIGADHKECMVKMEKHPRLYAQETGMPGLFPVLCGGCRYRKDLGCQHPDAKGNGGAGLEVKLVGGLPRGVILCPPPKIVRRAVACAGRDVTAPPPAVAP